MSSTSDPLNRSSAGSLVEVLRMRAEHQADRTAFIFLDETGEGQISVTYGQLDRLARRVASLLQDRCNEGEPVLLLYPTGIEFLSAFAGCLYAGMLGIPLFPPRPNRSLSRIQAIMEDSGCRVALTVDRVREALASQWEAHPEIHSLDCLATDTLAAGQEEAWREWSPGSDDTAYLQYTSGSTSAPRGVMVSHGNLVYNCSYMKHIWELRPTTRAVTWLPHAHDMGLIDGLLNPVVHGYPSMVMSPAGFVRSPIRWLKAIDEFRGSHSGAPNFAFELCVRKVNPERRAELDLSTLENVYSGAEPVRRDSLERFAEAFAVSGFRPNAFSPGYGLAEATLVVSGTTKKEHLSSLEVESVSLQDNCVVPAGEEVKGMQSIVSCGRVHLDTQVVIVDPATGCRCPANKVGEIWVSGPTVAGGYRGRPEESRTTFQAQLNGDESGPFLRTGDLGFLDGGRLYIAGRHKDLVIIRGTNYYPQDLEWAAETAHPAVRPGCSAAFSIERDGEEHLAIVAEIHIRGEASGQEVYETIAQTIRIAVLDQFEIDVFAVQLLPRGSIPKTSSGKIQRYACRQDFLQGNEKAYWTSVLTSSMRPSQTEVPSWDLATLRSLPPQERRRELKSYLLQLAGRVLGMSWEQMDPKTPLGAYGLDSLKGTELVSQLQHHTGVSLSEALVYNCPTVAELTDHLLAALEMEPEQPAGGSAEAADMVAQNDSEVTAILDSVNRVTEDELRRLSDRTEPTS